MYLIAVKAFPMIESKYKSSKMSKQVYHVPTFECFFLGHHHFRFTLKE